MTKFEVYVDYLRDYSEFGDGIASVAIINTEYFIITYLSNNILR